MPPGLADYHRIAGRFQCNLVFMQLVLLAGAPGVGKSTAAHHLLEEVYRRGGDLLVQWIEVEGLWRHQPWQVNDRTTRLRDQNLHAVLSNAAQANVDIVVVTWVFASEEQLDLVRAAAPAGSDVTVVQLTASEEEWRQRFGSDPLRKPIRRSTSSDGLTTLRATLAML